MRTAPFYTTVLLCGAFSLAGISAVFGLLCGLPLIGILLIIAATSAAWWWTVQTALREQFHSSVGAAQRALIVCATVTAASCVIIKAHGAYDAWLQWNALAKYMSSAAAFRYLHQTDSIWHAEYPPGLPAVIGLLWRITGGDGEWVPRSISFLTFLCIPLLLCEVAAGVARMRYLWVVVLALFVVNFECLSQGLNQYADVPLSLFLLLSFMLLDVGKVQAQRQTRIWLFAALGVMLGGCLLMKNEAQLLVGCFLFANARTLLRRYSFLPLALGIFPALICLFCYKHYVPEGNDLLHQFDADILGGIGEVKRWTFIGKYILRFALGRFPLMLIFFVWAGWKLRGAQLLPPGPKALMLVLSAAGFVIIYLTHHAIWWLVPTTLNRLMMQLLPSAIYAVLIELKKRSEISGAPFAGMSPTLR